jgi:hypothetical protein
MCCSVVLLKIPMLSFFSSQLIEEWIASVFHSISFAETAMGVRINAQQESASEYVTAVQR